MKFYEHDRKAGWTESLKHRIWQQSEIKNEFKERNCEPACEVERKNALEQQDEPAGGETETTSGDTLNF